RPVFAAHAEDEHTAVRRAGDRRHRGRHVRAVGLQHSQIAVPGGADIVRGRHPALRDLDLLVHRYVLEEGDVDDLDRHLFGLVPLDLRLEPEIDDAPDPVVDERAPAVLGQTADAVGSHDGTRTSLAAVLDRMAAEVAYI